MRHDLNLNTVTLWAMWKTTVKSYSIYYNLNDGSGGPSPNPQTGETAESFVTLNSSKPSKTNYEFKGWCSVSTNDSSCSGATYDAGSQYPLSSSSNNVTLWAIWRQYPSLSTARCSSIQSGTPFYYNYMGKSGTVYVYKDSRSGYCYSSVQIGDNNGHTTYSAASGFCSNYGSRLFSWSECLQMDNTMYPGTTCAYSWLSSGQACPDFTRVQNGCSNSWAYYALCKIP